MGQPCGKNRGGRHHKNNLAGRKSFRTKRRKKDTDEIRKEMLSEQALRKLKTAADDGDLPGLGRNFCVACNRHMVDLHALQAHLRSKLHKRRIKQLREEPYSHKEAEQASGMGRYTPKTDTVSSQVLHTATLVAIRNPELNVAADQMDSRE